MSNKLTAIRRTTGQMALFLIAIVVVTYLASFVSVQVFAYTVLALMIFGVAYLLYHINIDKLESSKRMEEAESRIQKIREQGL